MLDGTQGKERLGLTNGKKYINRDGDIIFIIFLF